MIKFPSSITFWTALFLCSAALAGNDNSRQFDYLGDITELMSARSLDQTDDGTIWFGTNKCLYSYDGYDLKSYPGRIGQKAINSLQHKGTTLYLGCNDGLLAFDTETQQYQRFDYFNDERIRKLALCGDDLYIGGEAGLYRYRLNGQMTANTISKISSANTFSLFFDSDTLWVGTAIGIDYLECSAGKYHEHAIERLTESGRGIVVPGLYKDEDGVLWAGTISSLIKIDLKTLATERVAPLRVTKDILFDHHGGLYIGTDNGLVYHDMDAGTTETVSESVVAQCLMDRDSDIWFASENGIFKSRQGTSLGAINTGGAPENTLYQYIYQDTKGRLWVASTHGLSLYQADKDSPYRLVARYSMGDTEHPLPHNNIKTIAEDKHDGSIYLATDTGYLKFDEDTQRFVTNRIIGTHNWVYDILIDGNNIWVASFDGLYCMTGGEISRSITTEDGLSNNDVAQIAKDRFGNIWMLTRDQQVYTLMSSTKALEASTFGQYTEHRFASCILNDMEGSIWLAAGNEIVYYNSFSGANEPTVIGLDSQKSLEVYSMADILGRIWVCTSEGIFLIDKSNYEISHINSGKKYVCASLNTATGDLILGALGRISYLPSSDLGTLTSQDDRKVAITSILVNGRRQMTKAEIDAGTIILPARENNLTISFSDFNYNKEMPGRFHVFVHGHKPQWNDLVQSNTINFPDMKPGRYKVFITAKDQLDADDTEAISIRIRHPWYSSIAMILLYMALLAGAIFWTIRFFTLKRYLDLEREQRDALLEQSKEKEAFFGNIAHEFKTPLSLVIAPLSKLLQEAPDGEEKEMVKIAHDNATKLNALVHHAIEYYRQDYDSATNLIRSEVEFVEFAREIFQSFKDNYPGLEFIFDSSNDTIKADVDVVKMEAVLNNLLSNACKYTPEGGSVIMTIEKDENDDRLIVKVSDTGVGIPEDELDLVFQRYYESSRTKDGNYDGTGIGLPIIKKNIEAHSGSISVASDNNGTTFTAVIPCHLEAKASGAEYSSAENDETNTDKPLVVIVDDNAQICSFLEKVLKAKYRCITTGNGKSGFKLCKDVMPDLIVSDVMMPVMDGLEMCRQIREYSPLSTIPIIMLTAKGDTETERKSLELNIDAFIPKPFEFGTLVAKIDQLIGNKKRMEQKIRLEMISVPNVERQISYDEKFLMKVTRMIEEHMEDSEFSVRSLCELGGYSEKQLYRKIKQLTGLSTVEYIRSIRIKKAALLFQTGNYTVSEVMYMVGFANASYFTRSFAAEYGKTPSEYLKSYKNMV